MGKLDEGVTDMRPYVSGRVQVIQQVRASCACSICDAITPAAAPAMPTPRSSAMLLYLLVRTYSDHLQLYRQCTMLARQGLELDRSTLRN
jgi:transposase